MAADPKRTLTDSPVYDTAALIFRNVDVPTSAFVDIDPLDMCQALAVAQSLSYVDDVEDLRARLLFDADNGKVEEIYSMEAMDTDRIERAKGYFRLLPPPADMLCPYLAKLNPMKGSCRTLVAKAAMQLLAYDMLSRVAGRLPNVPFERACLDAIRTMAAVGGRESQYFQGASRHLERYTSRLESETKAIAQTYRGTSVERFSRRTLDRRLEDVRRMFLGAGSDEAKLKCVRKDAFPLYFEFPVGSDERDLLMAMYEDAGRMMSDSIRGREKENAGAMHRRQIDS